jgi:hypothetical protein
MMDLFGVKRSPGKMLPTFHQQLMQNKRFCIRSLPKRSPRIPLSYLNNNTGTVMKKSVVVISLLISFLSIGPRTL